LLVVPSSAVEGVGSEDRFAAEAEVKGVSTRAFCLRNPAAILLDQLATAYVRQRWGC
jgi:hypothetical protein